MNRFEIQRVCILCHRRTIGKEWDTYEPTVCTTCAVRLNLTLEVILGMLRKSSRPAVLSVQEADLFAQNVQRSLSRMYL